MLYKPNYCCQCGEKISRAEWRLLTSRRFCELCETEFKGTEYVPRAIIAVGLVLSIFGFRAMFTEPGAPASVSATAIPKTTLKSSVPSVAPSPRKADIVPQTDEAVQDNMPAAAKTIEQPASPAKSSEQPTYFCGALTKKGSPCSRRVKTKGIRCWQHDL